MGRKRHRHTAEFKAKIAIEAVKEDRTNSQLASEYKVATSQISTWKKQLLKDAPELFGARSGPSTLDLEAEKSPLFEEIGRLKMELEWLKKKAAIFNK